ncbi:probable glycosyltransferase At5g03795 isoform X1 [Salvia splendens]|uniref:probable glycosyltransferase At5g03795 isoform X1 n=1 Tax=Salvia splendens TaxID=180675 RepID=UPI001C264BB6|nr:probable glycosyltransferase At5g03795 isoform X1 [Salvia splendens]XP_042057577.1 probable glycosyltransferase At5g03795 isoform X1 [Salvia splendens]XP_042057578.1 probable glycosyltransferase At5g03795 isoform X1 [Salvia splendens]
MTLPSLRYMLRSPHRKWWNTYFLILSPLTLLFITSSTITFSSLRPQIPPPIPPPPTLTTPYHNWEIFNADYQQMLNKLKIYVYPHAFPSNKSKSSPTAAVFLPNPDPFNPKTGNYYSEHAFKLALLRSSLVTDRPDEADFFFMPFSVNVMRYHPLFRSESAISDFVAGYVSRISSDSGHWNASGGADHFFVCCHSVGRDAASRHRELHNNAIQITCSSSYFQRLYTPHKDVALPQVWPRPDIEAPDPPHRRSVGRVWTELVFFAGRAQNSAARQEVLRLWGNDSAFRIFAGHASMPYEEGFRRSRYCLHIKGYEVNTARVVDAIHYGCVPVLISNYYDLPFANILDWTKFSIVLNQHDIPQLKNIITSVPEETYLDLYRNLCVVRKHFRWSPVPRSYDTFHMTAYQLWLRRGLHRVTS